MDRENRTPVQISRDIHREIGHAAVDSGLTLRQIVEAALRDWLRRFRSKKKI
jgi:hypothetical protein